MDKCIIKSTKSLYEYIVNSLINNRIATATNVSKVTIYGKPETNILLYIDIYPTHVMFKHLNEFGIWCTSQDIKQYA